MNSINRHKGKNFCNDLNLKRVSFAEQTDYNIRKEKKRLGCFTEYMPVHHFKAHSCRKLRVI